MPQHRKLESVACKQYYAVKDLNGQIGVTLINEIGE